MSAITRPSASPTITPRIMKEEAVACQHKRTEDIVLVDLMTRLRDVVKASAVGAAAQKVTAFYGWMWLGTVLLFSLQSVTSCAERSFFSFASGSRVCVS